MSCMTEKTMQLDGVDIRVEKDDDGNITAEPAGPTSITEVAEAVRDIVSRPNDARRVRVYNGKVRVEPTPLYTDDMVEIKSLGLSLSYISRDGEAVFVHDELGETDYTYAYGSDGSEQ